MSEKDGGPAFPTVDANREADYGTYGLTKLEWFAGHAMAAMIIGCINNGNKTKVETIVHDSWVAAELMVAESEARKS